MLLRTSLALAFVAALALALESDEPLTLTPGFHHLGDDRTPEWTETTPEPEGVRLDLAFVAESARDHTVAIDQRDVNGPTWRLFVGEREVATLATSVARTVEHYEIPADALVLGENRLSIVADEAESYDDIVIGPVRLFAGSLREVFDLAPFRVDVRERGSGRALPVRLTIVDADGAFPPIWYGERAETAVRDGIGYTLDGTFRAELPVGRYTVWASKGVEWSRARGELVVAREGSAPLELELERQVDTRGWVAADTHLHTLEFSGHGDASAAERIVTLAADGVELAIATEHNHQLDYRPFQQRVGATAWFTPVVGNEVTTRTGHFNAFPLEADGPLPDHTLEDWVALVDDVRATGAAVVILNHPRWPYQDDSPFALADLDPYSGARDGPRFTFDCLELVNSTCVMEDPFSILFDWLGVLNGGERVFCVGSSDSHTVGDPVGQGRTYVRSSTDDAGALDVAELAGSFRTGRASVSYGIVADLELRSGDRAFGLGEVVTLPEPGAPLVARVRVAAPHWVRPREVRLFANGVPAGRRAVPVEPDVPTDRWLELELALESDAHVVAAVLGDPVDEPFWHALNDGYTFAATNPVFVDADGDGVWASPAEQAAALLAGSLEPGRLADDPRIDDATCVQVLHRARRAQREGRLAAELQDELTSAARRRGSPFVSGYLERPARASPARPAPR